MGLEELELTVVRWWCCPSCCVLVGLSLNCLRQSKLISSSNQETTLDATLLRGMIWKAMLQGFGVYEMQRKYLLWKNFDLAFDTILFDQEELLNLSLKFISSSYPSFVSGKPGPSESQKWPKNSTKAWNLQGWKWWWPPKKWEFRFVGGFSVNSLLHLKRVSADRDDSKLSLVQLLALSTSKDSSK